MNCTAPANALQFTQCVITQIQPLVDAVKVLGGGLVACAIALAAVQLVKRLIALSVDE